MKLRTHLFLVPGLCFVLSNLPAQIVNIEDKRSTKDTIGRFWQIDFGGNLTENTRSIVNLTGALRLDIFRKSRQWLLLGNYNLVKSDADRVVNDGFGHLRYGHQLGGAWMWESFGQVQYNRRLLIDFRGLTGTGPRFQIHEDDGLDLALGLLYMYEYNELDNEGALLFRRDHRFSSYFTLQLKLSDNATFASTSYYQPLITRFGESRLSSINALNIRLGKHFFFSTNLAITYDALIASLLTDVPSTSYRWRNLLRISF